LQFDDCTPNSKKKEFEKEGIRKRRNSKKKEFEKEGIRKRRNSKKKTSQMSQDSGS
jgi:hypothetical protein